MNSNRLKFKYYNSCYGKLRHENSLTAIHHANSLMHKRDCKFIAIYYCDFCGGLHVGNQDFKQARRKEEFLNGISQ